MIVVSGLRVAIGQAEVLRGVELTVGGGEAVGLVGESGSGKSMLALALIGLLPNAARALGSVRLDGAELLGASDAAWRRVRGATIGVVFQEPATAMDPRRTVLSHVTQAARAHGRAGDAAGLLARVGLGNVPASRYPHQLSGGQRQRAMIAAALICAPALLLADEPTTALDSLTQARVLDLLAGLVAERAMAMLLISHDLSVVARACARVAVMYAGRVVEDGETRALLAHPRHPYTAGLLAASPHRAGMPVPIPGRTPDPRRVPAGCAFAPRCARADAACATDPVLMDGLACHHPL